jgi:putative transposase
MVLVTAAKVPERAGGKQLLQRVKTLEQQVWRLHTIWVDSGFDGSPFTPVGDGLLSLDCRSRATT